MSDSTALVAFGATLQLLNLDFEGATNILSLLEAAGTLELTHLFSPLLPRHS